MFVTRTIKRTEKRITQRRVVFFGRREMNLEIKGYEKYRRIQERDTAKTKTKQRSKMSGKEKEGTSPFSKRTETKPSLDFLKIAAIKK